MDDLLQIVIHIIIKIIIFILSIIFGILKKFGSIIEDKWFLYSHGSYFAEPPKRYMTDEQGHYIDENGNRVQEKRNNPYFDEFNKKWNEGKNHNQLVENPSKPVLVRPKLKSGIK